ncbi:MAG TPA: hypothetical protein VL027_08010 [Spongiibacteraceae bacterium]|jgi:heme/copper-type cytochrome/quinol oxidase subunit 2|nr:hypothetical protein [Spongiibacteraceae bacterium]HUH37873.1 hypothetical protein [Spongiibacteraceae bacterium]
MSRALDKPHTLVTPLVAWCAVVAGSGPARAAQHRADHTPTPLEWLIIGAAVLIVAAVLVYTVKYLVRPGETSAAHIKRRILHNGDRQGDHHD